MASIVSPIITGSLAALETVLISNQRSISNIFPDCAIEERHNDELTITQHPVEEGVVVSDHCYLQPAELIMRVGWSPSSTNILGTLTGGIADIASAAITGGLSGVESFLSGDKLADVYDELLALQAKRTPFTVVTGKRVYDNMLMRSLRVTTDRDTENVLMAEAIFQEVIIVATKTATLPPLTQQLNPADTASPTQTSPVQPEEDKSLLLKGKDALGGLLKSVGIN